MIDESLVKRSEMHIDAICDLAIEVDDNKRLLEQADCFRHLLDNYTSLIEQNAELHKELAKLKGDRVFVVNGGEK